MRIFLIGLPGSGKSTIGKSLSQLTNYRLMDTDEIICRQEGSSIETIFKNKGEDHFRKAEQRTLHNLLSQENIIVSTGGGLPCFFDNMEVINKNGISIFLNVPPDQIAERLWTVENQHRPMIQGKSKDQLLAFLNSKSEERFPYYKQAKFEFKGSHIQAEEILLKLKSENLI